jgi:diguanylate cyclase (GGDEF)-like protein/excisionase family DNA binding protein
LESTATSAYVGAKYLTVSDAARVLGVHANTVRAWTDQGLLQCLRINGRGDRRYTQPEIARFLAGARSPRRAGRDGGVKARLAIVPSAIPSDVAATASADELLALTGHCAGSESEPSAAIARIAEVLCAGGGYRSAVLIDHEGRETRFVGRLRPDRRLARRAIELDRPLIAAGQGRDGTYRAAVPVPATPGVSEGGGAVLLLEGTPATRTAEESRLLTGIAAQIDMAVHMAGRVDEAAERQRRAEMLMSMSSEIGARLDPTSVLSQLVERAAELFNADHAGVFSRHEDGLYRARVTRNLSPEFCQIIEHAASLPLARQAFEERRVVTAADYPDDPRAIELRPVLVREGINTVTIAPLFSEGEPLGILSLYHDHRYEWVDEDLVLFQRLAQQGATAVRIAQNFSQMATWAAQLQSIQQLGARLTRLRTVQEIGQAICTELNQLINSHNIRVYRVEGDDCMPVAWRGEVGEYEGEDGEQLRVKVGEGITGWVARYGLAQNLGDAAGDRRAKTIPGTEDDLDESLLLAPMLYEDETIGVIVLAKLGLNQFTADDLRLLEIYASIAAQAMANADATERLRAQSEMLSRQLNSQRELLRVTESILGTLDTQALLERIADSLGALLQVDNICVDVHDEQERVLRPIFARGIHAADYMAATLPDDQGEGGHVIKTGEPVLIEDALTDTRVAHFANTGPVAGSLIVAPLRSGQGIQGVLTIERLGDSARFTDEEFELVKLFAAHVSIALRNAATHREVEIRAETDRLTGLLNHGALIEHLDALVSVGTRFAMLMVDLDHFKTYNDQFGHQAGNVVLQRVARLLKASCRSSDLVFRFGGDEFVLLLPGAGVNGARAVAEKVRGATASIGKRDSVSVTCSVGIAAFPRDGRDGAAMILAADRACYAGKRAGRNRIATAAEGLVLAGDFRPTEPMPVEVGEASYSAA